MPSDGEPMTDDEQAVIAVITDALCAKFGERALTIARSQAEAAKGDARKTWLVIVEQLEAQAPPL